jgi:TrmH family RNA methyltransferase
MWNVMEIVTSTANPRVKAVKRLHAARERRATGQSIAEGPNALAAVLDAGITPSLVLHTAEDDASASVVATHRIESIGVSQDVLSAASDTQHPRGPVIVFPIPERSQLRHVDTVVLVGISDPGNVGTIVRSAAAFGWDVGITGDTADPWGPKAIRSSASAVFATHIITVESPLENAAEMDLISVATVAQGGVAMLDVADPAALLIGAEAAGLPQSLTNGADLRLTIEMPGGAESLNAAVAASIAMYGITAGR